ncbi:MAG: hypothetical protein U0228_19540 [Myxococcaceae bacterium]
MPSSRLPFLVVASLALAVGVVAGCGSTLGRAQVHIVFDQETVTKCVKVSARKGTGASIAASPAALDRGMRDELLIGIGETKELTGEVLVTVRRFDRAGCPGTELSAETKSVTLVPGAGAMLEFRYGGGDAGVDGGDDGGVDGGTDGGCDTSACVPGVCQSGTPACGCVYARASAGTPCDGGLCSASGTCEANPCAALADNMPCDIGLTCTSNSRCFAGQCVGMCSNTAGPCQQLDPSSCDSPTDCHVRAANEGANCGTGGVCRSGACFQWLTFAPQFDLRASRSAVPIPDAGWVLTSSDGGPCDTIIDTSGATPTVVQADCGQPAIFSLVDDAGVAVMLNSGVFVGPNARLHFVGARPAQVIVLGDALINGLISVAPTTAFPPAGVDPAACTVVPNGVVSREGGGGGGFGGFGGKRGNNNVGLAGINPTLDPLRGGCTGGTGFSAVSAIDGGSGGGAIDLIVAGTLLIKDGGVVSASGGGGAGAHVDDEGGGGGGSGGTVILEAKIVDFRGGAVTSNGGGGAEGGGTSGTPASGAPGPLNVAARAAGGNAGTNAGAGGRGGDNNTPAGEDGANNAQHGGGGGGGGVGVIFIKGHTSCTGVNSGGVISGAQPTSLSCN